MEYDGRFRRFVERKTRAATTVRLFPYRTVWAAPHASALSIQNAWSRALFDGPFYLSPVVGTARPTCSLVFVQSADGNTVVSDPAELGGGDTDKHLIYEGLSRVAADAVMAGAETVRNEDLVFSVWHPELVSLRASLALPRHPAQIIVTLRGLPVDRMLLGNLPEVPVILITIREGAERMRAAAAERPWVTIITMEDSENLAAAFATLRAWGIRRVSCVGGRTVASELLRHGLVDDVYLTTGAREGGTPGTPLSDSPWRGRTVVRKKGTGPEAGVTFEHILAATGNHR